MTVAQLAEGQLGRLARFNLKRLIQLVDTQLQAGEQPLAITTGKCDGYPSIAAVTDRRFLVASKTATHTIRDVPLDRLTQIDGSATTLLVRGAGVELKVTLAPGARTMAALLRTHPSRTEVP